MGWRYNAGLALIGTVVFIWVASAEVTQRIFEEYAQPFALTYLGVSLLVIYLPIAVLRGWVCRLANKNLLESIYKDDTCFNNSTGLDIPLKINYSNCDLDEDIKSHLMADMHLHQAEEGYAPTCKNEEDELNMLKGNSELGAWEIAKCGFYLAPVWFLTEYLSNSALANTSVASTTVLTSTSGLFTLFFGALLGQDSVNITKIVAVCISMTGVGMTTLGKTWARDEMMIASELTKHSIMGDIFGLLSAMSYGLFTVLLKKAAGSEEGKLICRRSLDTLDCSLLLVSGGLYGH
ncbi:hypothetical protein NMG60_11001771 [Bertholletia excelsa]